MHFFPQFAVLVAFLSMPDIHKAPINMVGPFVSIDYAAGLPTFRCCFESFACVDYLFQHKVFTQFTPWLAETPAPEPICCSVTHGQKVMLDCQKC